MRHYLYVTDIEGREVPGSRRSIDRTSSCDQVAAIEADHAAKMGDGCSIEDNVPDWQIFWQARNLSGRS
jgi:hypothetical protein